ncbi:hypothetical protein Tco_0274759, partial [Tanacetum coccineum]
TGTGTYGSGSGSGSVLRGSGSVLGSDPVLGSFAHPYSCLDEWEGLPCPLEDFAFICEHTTWSQLDLSTIFDGIDDDNDKEDRKCT